MKKSDCSAADSKFAGGHWNPKATENGVLANTKGDIGNFTADASGNGTILTTDEWNIGSEIQQKRHFRKRTDCT
jgi:Cu-Zn family superoxide dismutase